MVVCAHGDLRGRFRVFLFVRYPHPLRRLGPFPFRSPSGGWVEEGWSGVGEASEHGGEGGEEAPDPLEALLCSGDVLVAAPLGARQAFLKENARANMQWRGYNGNVDSAADEERVPRDKSLTATG